METKSFWARSAREIKRRFLSVSNAHLFPCFYIMRWYCPNIQVKKINSGHLAQGKVTITDEKHANVINPKLSIFLLIPNLVFVIVCG
jgi:hypothetical protein